ncbi:MAG: phosphotransferase, partial [Opitutae bacterium]|nr:phosphotransferase [Opitutae bacterium]
YVVMDAPPDKEPCEPFVKIAELLLKAGVRVPEILAQDLNRGFLVLSDFGDLHYQEAIEGKGRDSLYDLALEQILKLQTGLREEAKTLDDYDKGWVRMELEIFREWCLPEFPQDEYEKVTTLLVETFLEQPRVFVHRDFHCRNLLVLPDGTPGVIDFQGALHGPLTYDPVSLLRDCYVENDEDWIASKVLAHKSRLVGSGILPNELSDEAFLRWFDFTGLQRHLKCIGIFHRLKLRDGKGSYLADVPRVLRYAKTVLSRWPELEPLRSIVDQAQILA